MSDAELIRRWFDEPDLKLVDAARYDDLRDKARALLAALPRCEWRDGCSAAGTREWSAIMYCDGHGRGACEDLPHAPALRALAKLVGA
jgi:hypothetical protein